MSNRKYEVLLEVKGDAYLVSAELKRDPVEALCQVHLDLQNSLNGVHVTEIKKGKAERKKKQRVVQRYRRDEYKVIALRCAGITYDQARTLPAPNLSGQIPRGKVILGTPLPKDADLEDWAKRELRDAGWDV